MASSAPPPPPPSGYLTLLRIAVTSGEGEGTLPRQIPLAPRQIPLAQLRAYHQQHVIAPVHT